MDELTLNLLVIIIGAVATLATVTTAVIFRSSHSSGGENKQKTQSNSETVHKQVLNGCDVVFEEKDGKTKFTIREKDKIVLKMEEDDSSPGRHQIVFLNPQLKKWNKLHTITQTS